MSGRPTKILLVEDNPGDARLLQEALAEAGSSRFEMAHVERLSEALRRLSEERFDVILLDLSLPDGQGLDTVVSVRQRAPVVPIVVLTGLVDEELAVKALREGAQDYLVKGQVDGNLLARAMRYGIERKRAEEEIKASMVELEKALQVKSDFLGTMSHELRTPLHVIMSNVALLVDGLCGEVNEEQAMRLKVVERNSEDLLRLVQGVLDITRIEEGRMPLQLEEIHVGEILNEVQAEFHDLSLKRGITLEVDNNGSTPPMLSDRLKLKEILHNLISNALKFTKDGKIEVKGCHLKEKDRIELVVQDSGIGIQEEDLPHIFDVFYQVDSSNQREFGGTGLGLNIVKKLVELLQGEIRVESEFGKGSTFYVTLPREVSVSHPS